VPTLCPVFSELQTGFVLFVPCLSDQPWCLGEGTISQVVFTSESIITTRFAAHLLLLENTFLAKGGPARHLHYDQEEGFYILEARVCPGL
jgi:hypothetical protein